MVSYLLMFKISALGGYYGLHTRPESAENVGKVTQKLCNGVNCLFFWPRFRPWDQVPLIMAKLLVLRLWALQSYLRFQLLFFSTSPPAPCAIYREVLTRSFRLCYSAFLLTSFAPTTCPMAFDKSVSRPAGVCT